MAQNPTHLAPSEGYIYIYMMAAPGLPVPPPPEWVGSKTYVLATFSYIFMEPAKTHGIYTVLTSSASETVVFAAFCNTTLYTTTLIVLLLQKQQHLLLLLPLLRTTTYYNLMHIHTYDRHNIFVCIHNKNDTPTLLGHVHTYKHIVIPIHGCRW